MRLFLFSGLATIAFITAAHADGPMSAAELKKLAPGTYHVAVATVSMDVNLATNGKISGATSKGDKDQGRWRIVGDRICVTFKRWLDHKEKCDRLSQAGTEIKGGAFSAWKR